MARTFIYRRPELVLVLGFALGCSKQSEPETPAQPYPQQGAYPQQQGQYPAGQYPTQQYPEQQQQYPAQQQPYPAQQQPYPAQQQPYPAQQQPYPAQQQPYPTAPAPTQPQPGALPGAPATAAAAPLATAIDPSMAAAVQPVLTQLASTKAPAGSKPIGSLMAANFQQGQQLEAQVQMEPGKCYTVVGAALPTITELDLKLLAVTPLPGMSPILAVDNTTGGQAVLGEKPNCYKWAWPIAAPVKVVIAATGGQGLAAAQLFGK